MSSVIFEKIEGAGIYGRIRRRVNRQIVDFLRKKVLQNRQDALIMEAACGGGYAVHLLSSDPSVALGVALDNNLKLFDLIKPKNFQGRLVVADIYSMPFFNERFDLLWNSSSIEELPDPEGAIAAMTSLVKPGGYVFVGVPHRYSLLAFYYLLPLRKLREWVGRPYSGKEIARMFSCNSLQIIDALYYGFGLFVGVLGRKP